MGLRAGRLRHRITIEQRTRVQAGNGDLTEGWAAFAADLPAEISPMSAREFVAARAMQSEATGRIVIRWIPGVTGAMRARDLDDGTIYNILAPMPDPGSGREWLTLPVSTGVNSG